MLARRIKERQFMYWARPSNWRMLYRYCREHGMDRWQALGEVILFIIGLEKDYSGEDEWSD